MQLNYVHSFDVYVVHNHREITLSLGIRDLEKTIVARNATARGCAC